MVELKTTPKERARLRHRAENEYDPVEVNGTQISDVLDDIDTLLAEVERLKAEREPGLCEACGIVAVPGPSHARACVRQQLSNAANRGKPCPWCAGPALSDQRFNMGPAVFDHRHTCPRSAE